MDLELTDKVAVITGGSVGIGLAVARALAKEGVHLAICARDEVRLFRESQAIAAQHHVEVFAKRCDVSKADEITDFIDAVNNKYGGTDILINNAGAGTNEKIIDAPDEKWQHFWDLHVMAAVRFSRGFMSGMADRGGGVILNNASICARQPLGYEPIYNTTKAALSMFSKCLANECIPMNIRVNTINPGLIITPDWLSTAEKLAPAENISAQAYLDKIAKDNTPIGRFGTPEELANFFVFLCSDKASYCVGSTYYVDGGWLNVVE
ncbi:MAG: SDR family oxidoreductase [Saprospiraceae bacterium]|nr:SDR family oxidoreductase [Saprospiraceae bacterium]